jgi:drug/metabolite transporter (DMT)-like permease
MKKNINYIVWSLAIIIAAILWSLDWTLIRPQFYSLSPIIVVFLEHFLGAIALSPFIFLGYKKLKIMKKKDFISLFWVCLFWWLIWTLAITEAFFSAYRWETTVSTIIILQKLQPVFALFLASIVLKEKLDKNFYFWAILSIVSAYFIAFWSLWSNILNVNFLSLPAVYALIAAFAFGSSTVFWKNLVDDLWFELTTFLRFAFTSLLAFITFLTFGSFWDFSSLTTFHYELLALIVFTSWAWALFLYYFWLKKISASAATIFELAWPLSAIFFDYYFNWNVLTPIQIIFSLILLLSFFMIVTKRKIFL